MDHFLEVSKITEWALKNDPVRVLSYANQLVEKLVQTGDMKAAERLKATVNATGIAVQPSGLGSQSRLPVDSESRLALADEETPALKDNPVVFDKPTLDRVEDFLSLVKKADELEAHGVGMPPSLICYGPPGVGKTRLARYIAARLGMPLITARADTLISSFLGSTSKNLRTLFDHIAHRNCILFLDEIDAFAKLRDDHQELGELKRVVVSLLQNLDSMNPHSVMLAATNHEHLLDPAIWRRFTFKLHLDLPGPQERATMLKLFLGNFASTTDIDSLAALASGITGSDLKTLCHDAIRDGLVNNREIDQQRLIVSFLQIRLKGVIDTSSPTSALFRAIRDLDSKFFTTTRIAALFGTTASTVSRNLRKKA